MDAKVLRNTRLRNGCSKCYCCEPNGRLRWICDVRQSFQTLTIMRSRVGTAILLIQLGMIVFARFHPARYFCWAPHDAQAEYELSVVVAGRALSDTEIRNRYRMAVRGRDPRAIQHRMDVVRIYETTYGRHEDARVRMTYTINGLNPRTWTWPPDVTQ